MPSEPAQSASINRSKWNLFEQTLSVVSEFFRVKGFSHGFAHKGYQDQHTHQAQEGGAHQPGGREIGQPFPKQGPPGGILGRQTKAEVIQRGQPKDQP